MAKTIRFPLEMANGVKVRTLEELRANFDLEKILYYYLDGRLCTWLSNGDYHNEREEIKKIDENSEEFVDRLCDVLGVRANGEAKIDWLAFQKRNEKRLRLKNFTDDWECFEKIDVVAFDQKELDELIQTDADIIYLVSGNYSISVDRENIIYKGIGKASIDVNMDSYVDLERKKIKFQNIEFTNPLFDKKMLPADGSEVCLKNKLTGAINNMLASKLEKELQKIINDFQACRLEKEYLRSNLDYELDTDYDGSYRFDSEEEAEEAAENRISRMHDEYYELLGELYDLEYNHTSFSDKLGWKYAVQIIKKFIDLKLQIKNLYEGSTVQCPSILLKAEAEKKTMGRDEDGEFVSACSIYLDFRRNNLVSAEKSKLNLEIPSNSSAKYSSDLRPLFDNLYFGINEKVLKRSDPFYHNLIAEEQIKFDISADQYNEEYCYHINTELLLEDLDQKASDFADCVYSNQFIHQYFETMKNNFAKSFEEEMKKEEMKKEEKQKDHVSSSFNMDNLASVFMKKNESTDTRFSDFITMRMGGIVL